MAGTTWQDYNFVNDCAYSEDCRNGPWLVFLGGITANYASNLIMQGDVTDKTVVVVEADEFDRSFLRLFPEVAIVTSSDADHLDIYGDHDSVITSFKDYIGQINKGGTLIIHESIADQLAANVTHVTKKDLWLEPGTIFCRQHYCA